MMTCFKVMMGAAMLSAACCMAQGPVSDSPEIEHKWMR